MRKSVFFQQDQKVDLKTRYTTLSYGLGHNLSPELSTFAPSVPWLDGNPSFLEKLHPPTPPPPPPPTPLFP